MNPPSTKRIFTTYAIAGPLIGALVIVIGTLLEYPATLPLREFLAFAAMALVFSLPFGLLPALIAALAHVLAVHRFKWRRTRTVLAVCVCGVAAAFGPGLLFGNARAITASAVSMLHFVAPAFIAALLISLRLTRPAYHIDR